MPTIILRSRISFYLVWIKQPPDFYTAQKKCPYLVVAATEIVHQQLKFTLGEIMAESRNCHQSITFQETLDLMIGITLLALGSNLEGLWGNQEQILDRAARELQLHGCTILHSSRIYKSVSLNPGQPPYFNQVLLCRASLSPPRLLRLAKTIERQAGRRPRAKWSARTLDIDIVMTGGQRLNWPHRGAGSLTLPHPEAHKRIFVLQPLCDVTPHWYHPALRRSAITLLHQLPPHARQSIRRV